VTTNAVGLLLNYLLEAPLSLRRVTWLANARNERSVKAAERMGFRLEGVMRWHRILPEGKDGQLVELEGLSNGRGPGRDTAMLSICWDDWRDGVKDRVHTLVDRQC
jgi:RimJ/RimL family protein N-acetyltransferase